MKKYVILLSLLMVGSPAYSQLKWLTKFAGLFKVRSNFLERRRIQRKHLELMKKEELAEPLFNRFAESFKASPYYMFPKIVSPHLTEEEINTHEKTFFEDIHESIQDNVLFCQSSLKPDQMTQENITNMLDLERKNFVNSTKIFFGVRKLVEIAEGIAETDEQDSNNKKEFFEKLDMKLQIAAFGVARQMFEKITLARFLADRTIFYDTGIQEYRKKCLDALKEAQQQNQ